MIKVNTCEYNKRFLLTFCHVQLLFILLACGSDKLFKYCVFHEEGDRGYYY